LAEVITAKRTSMKLTLVDVANALSISKPTLVKIEKDDMTVKFVTLLTVMEYLGLSFGLISDDFDSTNKATEESDVQWY
jgi:transcriptional regulator with XRE-family HTH domain